MDFIKDHSELLLAIGVGISLMLHAVAPATKNTYDDKAASWFDKVLGMFKRKG
jgi:hypothetical protein